MGGRTAGNASKRCTNGHADTGGVAFAEYIARHHFARDKQVLAGLSGEMNGGGFVGFEAQVGEGDAGSYRIGIKGGCVDGQGPVTFDRGKPLCMTVVECGVIKVTHLTGLVVVVEGFHEDLLVEPQGLGQLLQGVAHGAIKDWWHEATHCFGVGDGVGDLSRLQGHESTPNGITLGPEILAFVIKALGKFIHHDAKGDAINSGANAAVVGRRSSINGHHVRLGCVTDHVSTQISQDIDQDAVVVACAAHQKVLGSPLAPFVLTPGGFEFFHVGLKTTTGQDAALGLNPFFLGTATRQPMNGFGRFELAILELEVDHGAVVINCDAKILSASKVSIDQGLPPAHEKSIGPRGVQGA